MAMFTSAIHIYRRLPGESIRPRLDLISPASPLNPRLPLIPNSEKKNLREAFAGAYLEALSGYLGGIDASVGQVSDLAEQSHQLDLDLLDLAGIHEEAVRECLAAANRAPVTGDELVIKGKAFFSEVAAATSSNLTTGARVESLAR